VGPASSSRADDTLETTWETFRKLDGVASCRTAIQQLNSFFSRHPDQKSDSAPQPLPAWLGLEDEELAEVNSPGFTLLDAHYLDLCFLFRDAAGSFDLPDLPPVKRAEAAFAWVMRQVRLREGPGEPLPPQFVLRRGWGTSRERAFLFLALLQQMKIDGCLVTRPDGQLWVPGVLAGGEICLFDTRLGLPLPGPKGEGIATLAQIRTQADILEPLAADPKHPYDVTADQARQAETRLAWPLSALAPRMRFLEGLLADRNNQVHLAVDPQAVQEAFGKAAKSQSIALPVDNPKGDARLMAGMLRDFFPPAEGGRDRTGRKELAEIGLIPWGALPALVFRPQYKDVGLVQQLQRVYGQVFVQFPLPPPRRDAEDAKTQFSMMSPGSEKSGEGRGSRDDLDLKLRFLQLLMKAGEPSVANQPALHFSQAPKSARDDMLRGRWEEATTKLEEGLEQVRYQKGLLQGLGDPNQLLERWCREAFDAQGAFLKANREASRALNPETQAALEAARKRLLDLGFGGADAVLPSASAEVQPKLRNLPRNGFPLWLRAALVDAAKPMSAEATYLLALCKQEEAEQKQASLERLSGERPPQKIASTQDAWRTAADWWKTYLEENPSGPSSASARLWLARARAALGQPDAAKALLEDLSGNLSPLEETARLYRARHLK
jgi:hypothetical protein